MVHRIYINTGFLRKNAADGKRRPVIGVEHVLDDGSAHHFLDCNGLRIDGPIELVYRPDQPAANGASVVYVQTDAPVTVTDDRCDWENSQ